MVGGLASGDYTQQLSQVYLNGEVFEEGGIAISISGNVKLASVISQGCTPIGETWTLTRVEQNVIHEIGNRPAYEVLAETFNQLPPAEQKVARGHLLIGLVINEYLEEFHRGDFLIRNLLSADPRSGSIAVGAFPRPGQCGDRRSRRSPARAGPSDRPAEFVPQSLQHRQPVQPCQLLQCGEHHQLWQHPQYQQRRQHSQYRLGRQHPERWQCRQHPEHRRCRRYPRRAQDIGAHSGRQSPNVPPPPL